MFLLFSFCKTQNCENAQKEVGKNVENVENEEGVTKGLTKFPRYGIIIKQKLSSVSMAILGW